MSDIESRLEAMGLRLPEPARVPAGIVTDFAWARKHEGMVFLSGHGPLALDGTVSGPVGRVGAEVTPEQAEDASRLAALAMVGSLSREIDDLDRVAAWLRVDGHVLVAPGFDRTTNVMNGCSRLLLALFGPEVGRHARTAIGVAATPLRCPVIISAQVALKP